MGINFLNFSGILTSQTTSVNKNWLETFADVRNQGSVTDRAILVWLNVT